MQKTRYYLHKKDKCSCHIGAQMFVGNLPINLSEHKYAHIIRNLLEEGQKMILILFIFFLRGGGGGGAVVLYQGIIFLFKFD